MQSPFREFREGLRDIAPAMIAAIPIGLLFGALCAGKGLSPAEVALMGALVFAGGAQFAAVEIWRAPAPITVLAFSTLLINLRHVLMGASLAPKMRGFTPLQRALSVYVMADENWAMSERRALERPLTVAYFAGTAILFWLNWVMSTTLGALGGSLMGDPKRLGADFAFTALFIGLVAGFWKGRATAVTVAASALASAAVYVSAGPPWHVAAGALAGIAAAYAMGGHQHGEAAR
ncbi:branched-chain amino acid ABC transporter permease [Alsobacter soli]|uniref:Branched-chain amino acid ABC transporter permease n=1 Tax=Alsobacter soli TaxID=2109933 RepID=A0A2T1HU91_9HYPH|nr:AzlC family ABC transporter permease [Alsobacter soli]PSC05099.1 branched-chain amino acid ABC transporter permease [Alsobacter soli]